ncbi:hypothetical protein R1sor_025453 [Riccia sorocarpa]|uniref:Protein kinase domain-containing protein n=1 Tax=Riccia sorocarpa TaxID=122646 RepID=A0ABD3GBX5_9MARC
MASRGQGRAGGRGNQDREDRGKRPMVDPDPIREPVEETFEEGELTPIIMAQATVHPRPVDVGEGSSGRKKKKKRGFARLHVTTSRPSPSQAGVSYWNGRDIRQWKNLEHTTRGTRLPDNSGRLMNLITDHSQWFRDPSDEKDQHKWKNVEIFRAHRLEIMCTLWSALEFMHENDWLHCDIHVLNVFLHFPNWDYEDGQEEHRMPTWEDERSLVFAALRDLGMAQQVHVTASVNGRKYPRVPKKERDWIAPELVDSKIQKLAARNIHIHPVYEYNKATDVYALGVLTHQVCGDFFTDMTMPERIAYNKKYYALGAPKDTDPAGRNEILLKDLIQSVTHHHAHMRLQPRNVLR